MLDLIYPLLDLIQLYLENYTFFTLWKIPLCDSKASKLTFAVCSLHILRNSLHIYCGWHKSFFFSYPSTYVSCQFLFLHEITCKASNTGYHSKLKYSDIICWLPQAASAAALLSSALGCLSLQIFPKYRYLKVKKNSILPST